MVTAAQQDHFAESLLPTIQRVARRKWLAYRRYGEREDWIQDVTAVAWKRYVACLANGNTRYNATTLARFACGDVTIGKRVHSSAGLCLESPAADKRGLRVIPTTFRNCPGESSRESLRAIADYTDHTAAVDARLDLAAWIEQLPPKHKETAITLARLAPIRFGDIAPIRVALGICATAFVVRRRSLRLDWAGFTR